jgi:hypothetical protein
MDLNVSLVVVFEGRCRRAFDHPQIDFLSYLTPKVPPMGATVHRTGRWTPGDEVSEHVLEELVHRAGNDYDRWIEQVEHTGYCIKPVRLLGRAEQIDSETGEVRVAYDTSKEPDGSLLIACGDRRESRCPSCAARYRGDAFQIVASGLAGGKGAPETVAGHPSLFVTFTAPSFGAVHAHRVRGQALLPCRPRRSGKCRHGIPLACWRRHEGDHPIVGQPICARCFNYDGQILWNAHAPELWRRTTIGIRRALAHETGLSTREIDKVVRLSYFRVAEYQRRGALHFHVVMRLDGCCEEPQHFPAPPDAFNNDVVEAAVHAAARAAWAPCATAEGRTAHVRWGSQLEVRAIAGTAELGPQAVAAYIAKYATKSIDATPVDSEDNGHQHRLVEATRKLAHLPELRHLNLDRAIDSVGYKGHWSTKSRRYSTTFRALRHARQMHVKRQRSPNGVPLDAWGRPEDDQKTITHGFWRFVGCGYRTTGEAFLAMSAAARARENRRLALEELRSLQRCDP